jgi:cytochrome c-type biogenesis protein CcmF
MNNILLAVSAFVVFVGTIWPLVAEMMFDRKLSVGPPFFNLAFTPLMIVLGIILPVGAMLPWKRGKIGRSIGKLRVPFVAALACAGLAWAVQSGKSLQAPVGLFLGTWLVFGAVTDLFSRIGKSWSFSRLFRLPRADWGKSLAHSGLGVTMFAIAGMMAWSQEDIRVVMLNDDWSVGQFDLTLTNVRAVRGPNYQANVADIILSKNGATITMLNPEKRFYPVAKMPTTEAGIDYRIFRDVYIVLGDRQDNGGWTVRTYIKPLANWIWAGAMIMAFGGLLSLSDRRLRLGAGAGRRDPIGKVKLLE